MGGAEGAARGVSSDALVALSTDPWLALPLAEGEAGEGRCRREWRWEGFHRIV